MIEIKRNRTIRPSSRLEKSKSYKIDTKSVSRDDTLVVNIDHESKPFHRTFKFIGSDLAHKNNISFRVNDYGTHIDISWSGANPIGIETTEKKVPSITTKKEEKRTIKRKKSNSILKHTKTSFYPISNSDTTILILGTMPGDKSIELGEYYGHSRNKFWKIISTITDSNLPTTYNEKKTLLLKTRIGIWDVAHKAIRKGSLDGAIENEQPNEISDFIKTHNNLKVIGFNGTKSQSLYDKYFERESGIKYILLPSSSPANTGIDFDSICRKWKQILT